MNSKSTNTTNRRPKKKSFKGKSFLFNKTFELISNYKESGLYQWVYRNPTIAFTFLIILGLMIFALFFAFFLVGRLG